MNVQDFLIAYIDLPETEEIKEKGESLAKLSRLETCGKISKIVYNPISGKTKRRIMYCHQWRICPICAKIRKNDMLAKLQVLHREEAPYHLSVVHEHHTRNILRRIDKSEYVRLPIENEKFVLIHSPNDYIESKAEQTVDYHQIDITLFAETVYQTPERKRISGTLGPFGPRENEKPAEYKEVQVTAIEVNTTNEEDLKKIEQAVLDCEKQDQKTFYDVGGLQTAITVRENRFVYIAHEMGFYARVTHAETRFIPVTYLEHGLTWSNRLE